MEKEKSKEYKEHEFMKESLYGKVFERINLQSIGYYVKEGSNLKKRNHSSFTERECLAEMELQEKLLQFLDEETMNKIYPVVTHYSAAKEEIQFSLGMKAGAKLMMLLVCDSEYDC